MFSDSSKLTDVPVLLPEGTLTFPTLRQIHSQQYPYSSGQFTISNDLLDVFIIFSKVLLNLLGQDMNNIVFWFTFTVKEMGIF